MLVETRGKTTLGAYSALRVISSATIRCWSLRATAIAMHSEYGSKVAIKMNPRWGKEHWRIAPESSQPQVRHKTCQPPRRSSTLQAILYPSLKPPSSDLQDDEASYPESTQARHTAHEAILARCLQTHRCARQASLPR